MKQLPVVELTDKQALINNMLALKNIPRAVYDFVLYNSDEGAALAWLTSAGVRKDPPIGQPEHCASC